MGRFVKGVSGNPKGRPKGTPKKKKAEYLQIMRDVVTPQKWKTIVERATTDAKKGNSTARKWLSDYVLGRPVQRVKAEIKTTALTLEEWIVMRDKRLEDAGC